MAYRLVEKQVIYSSKRAQFEIHHLEDEATGRRVRREVVMHPGAVVVLALASDGRVVLIRNRRYAVGETLLELPAGTLEPGEDPADCAARELLEETGFRAGRIEPIGAFYSSPGILSEKMHAFAAYDLRREQQALEEGEEIELALTLMEDALVLIRSGEVRDAKTIATLLMYDRARAGAQALS